MVAAALLVSGCGSSAHSHAAQLSVNGDPVSQAADLTARVPGYRLAATMSVATPLGPQTVQMSGVYDTVGRTGEMQTAETIAGHPLKITELFSGLTFYLRAAGIPGLSRLAGGKPWMKFDMSRMLGAMGLGSLPTGTDPSQFLDYLRAVSSSTTRLGTANVRGVPTTHYHARIDLARYPQLVPSAQRETAQRSVATLESALGGHVMPVDAWIDAGNRVRQIAFAFGECVANQRLRVNMTMDLYGYGPQTIPTLPKASQSYDLTPLIAASMSRIKLGCSTT